MSDETMAQEQGEQVEVAVAELEEEWVSPGYDMVLGAAPVPPLVIGEHVQGANPASFIQAKGTGLKEDDIIAQASRYELKGMGGGSRAARRARKGRAEAEAEPSVVASVSPNRAFLAKCEAQIIDYHLTARLPDSQVVTRTWATDAAGARTEIYASWLLPGNERVRDLVEGYLDVTAGRDTPAAEDFEALKNALRP